MRRVAIYRRVSTAAQVDGFSLESQRDALVRLAESRGETWEDFCDPGISGEQFEERPALMDMLARLNEFDAVLVVDTSRLARNELVSALIRSELMAADVTVVTPSGEIDLTNPEGNLMSLAQAMVAQYEQQNRTRKMKIGLEAAARSGFWTGGEAPYGYRRVRSEDGHHSTLEVDPDESQVVKRIVDLIINDGLSTIDVCRELGSLGIRTRKGRRWTHRSLLHVIGRRHLIGEIPYHAAKEVIPRTFPPILDETTFNALQHELDRTRTSPRETQHTYPLSGRITCDCGETLIGTYRKDRATRYYVCRRNASSASASGRCPAKVSSRRADHLDEAVWSAVSGLLGDPSRLHAAACDFLRDQQERAPHVAKQRARLHSRLRSIEEDRIRTFRDAARLGLRDDEVHQLLEQLAEEKIEIESQLASLGSDPYVGTLELVSERVDRLASRARQRLETADSELQKDILAALSIEVAPAGNGFSVRGTLPELPPSPGKAKTMAPQRP